MSLFSEYIRVVIGAAVICGNVTQIVPKGHYEKAFRLITGVFLLRIIFVGLTMLSVSSDWQYIIKGLIILVACAIDMRKYRARK